MNGTRLIAAFEVDVADGPARACDVSGTGRGHLGIGTLYLRSNFLLAGQLSYFAIGAIKGHWGVSRAVG